MGGKMNYRYMDKVKDLKVYELATMQNEIDSIKSIVENFSVEDIVSSNKNPYYVHLTEKNILPDRSWKKIPAIKFIRNVSDLDLKKSKEFAESIPGRFYLEVSLTKREYYLSESVIIYGELDLRISESIQDNSTDFLDEW